MERHVDLSLLSVRTEVSGQHDALDKDNNNFDREMEIALTLGKLTTKR